MGGGGVPVPQAHRGEEDPTTCRRPLVLPHRLRRRAGFSATAALLAAAALVATSMHVAPVARAGPPIEGFVRGEQVFAATLTVGAREKPTGIQGDGVAVYVVHLEGAATTPGGRAFDALYQHKDPDAAGASRARSPRIEFRAGTERAYRDFQPHATAGAAGVPWPPFREDHVYEFLWRPRTGGPIAVVAPPLTLGTPPTDVLRGELTVTIYRAVRDEGSAEPKDPHGPLSRKEPAQPKDPAAPELPKTDPRGDGKADRSRLIPTHAPRLAPAALLADEWEASTTGSGRIHVEGDHLVLEVGADDFGPRSWSKVAIEGDFDLTIHYTLVEWSVGPRQSPVLDLYLSEEAEITASTIQVSRADFEDAALVFVQPGPDPTPAVGAKEGRLRVRRVGSRWTVWQADARGWAPLAQLERPMKPSTWIGFGLIKGGDGPLKATVRPSWTDDGPATDAAKAGEPPAPTGGDPSVVGTWEWSPVDAASPGPTGLLVFAADRSVAGSGGRFGTWTQDGRTVVLRWSKGPASVSLTVSEDGRTLTGRDASGASLRATRRP